MNVAILGGGAMGRVLAQMTEEKEGMTLAGIVEPLAGETLAALAGNVVAAQDNVCRDNACRGELTRGEGDSLVSDKSASDARIDVVIDFSNPANLDMLCGFCADNKCPAVIATTGYTAEQEDQIRTLAQQVPVVFSANYSLGVNVMKKVIADITPILEDAFDIEIIEKHHNKKLDAPSGTARMLLTAADEGAAYEHVFGRDGNRKRGKEIGVHAIRGGTIAGEHTVIYAGEDEILEVKHTAGSKKIFAAGALKAAAFAAEGKAGLYTMEDVLFG